MQREIQREIGFDEWWHRVTNTSSLSTDRTFAISVQKAPQPGGGSLIIITIGPNDQNHHHPHPYLAPASPLAPPVTPNSTGDATPSFHPSSHSGHWS